ncbi:sodium:solute symporter family protein [Mariniphaga sediminis]|uniref:Sodium:solute symporter family protein n=1 Tax=Mariniphaga sediminis TaxID=1628158 RepID=A0A399CTT1_9BACT|nr:sodium:solute symporter family protein [Mariniphaga sediminis]RIH62967.1 sodium:solute symporter family protein [Mariniphaga sediminis]
MSIPVIFVAVYFLLVVLLGILSWFKIKTPADYYVAGKKARLIPVSGSLLATILGGSAILGTIELSQSTGWAALWFLFCAALGLFVLAPLAKYVSRYGKFTLPGLLGHFFGERARFIASIIIPIAWLGIVGAQIIAAAKILSGLEIISYSNAAIFAGVVFLLYTLAGGQVSILKTDTLQSILIVAGLAALTVFASRTPEAASMPKLNAEALFNDSFSGIDLLILLLTYSVTFVVGPDIYSRVFCAKDEKTATRSILIVAFLLLPISFVLTYLGIFSGQTSGEEIISFAQHLLPDWFYGLFIAALLSAVMSSADTTLLTSSLILSELFHKDMEERNALQLTRIFIVILGSLSIVIALFVTSILQSLLLALTFFSGAFVVPMLAGLLKLKVVNKQVTSAILAGGFVALAGKLINLWGASTLGNLVIILAFAVNALFLFVSLSKREKE